jgi:hypothetical protein
VFDFKYVGRPGKEIINILTVVGSPNTITEE